MSFWRKFWYWLHRKLQMTTNCQMTTFQFQCAWYHNHDGVIKWTHFPRYWSFVRGIRRSLVDSPHKGQWRGALVLSLICAWAYGWANNRDAGDLRCNCGLINVLSVTQRCWERQHIIGQLWHPHGSTSRFSIFKFMNSTKKGINSPKITEKKSLLRQPEYPQSRTLLIFSF